MVRKSDTYKGTQQGYSNERTIKKNMKYDISSGLFDWCRQPREGNPSRIYQNASAENVNTPDNWPW